MLDNQTIPNGRSTTGGGPQSNQPVYNGPWLVGTNCHIIIDGTGFIVADNVGYGQESMREMGQEQTAPFFGDPVNIVDTASSDLTMLLPVGQNDFTNGLGSLKLETDPKGYELVNNLQLTPQKTLLNGPAIQTENLNTASPNDGTRSWQQGGFDGTVEGGFTFDYFFIGSHLYQHVSGAWNSLTTRYPINSIFGYAGFLLACYGDNGGDLFLTNNSAIWPINYNPYAAFRVNGYPYVIYKDGRIYAAFILPPSEAVQINPESGPDVSYMSWGYAVNYINKLGDGTILNSGLGPVAMVDKAPNFEMTIALPGIPWRGGAILRELYRTQNNLPGVFYRIADSTTLGALRTQWVDTATDSAIGSLAQWSFATQNNSAMLNLRGGDTAHNMWRSDTYPIWLPEYNGVPNTGDTVWNVATYRDSSGNEATIIGTTSGLFYWDGSAQTCSALRPMNYDFFNCYSMAVVHGNVYFTSSNRSVVHIWNNQAEAFLDGPWQIQYNQPYEIRLASAGEYLFVAVSGNCKYDGSYRQSIYRYDGTIFDWENYITIAAPNNSYPIIGKLISQHSFVWYPNNGGTVINHVTMDERYAAMQTSNVLFRSAMSDCGLPRLRKQVFAVMIRYLQLSAQPSTTLTVAIEPGDTIITVASTASFNVGDWISIDDAFPNYQESREIVSKTATTLTISHPLTNGAYNYAHVIGCAVYKDAAVVTLRNIFTADNPTARDIQIGGPYRSDYLFAYIHLPVPVYTFLDGVEIDYNPGTIMELVAWSMITGLNPPYYGLIDVNIRVQDQVKLPNNLFSPLSANDTLNALKTAYNKGAVDVVDQFNNPRKMRVQRLSIDFEEPKQRHVGPYQNQATAHIRLMDQDSELFKQEALVLGIPQNQ